MPSWRVLGVGCRLPKNPVEPCCRIQEVLRLEQARFDIQRSGQCEPYLGVCGEIIGLPQDQRAFLDIRPCNRDRGCNRRLDVLRQPPHGSGAAIECRVGA
jgi:hypothetical protein